MIKSELRVLAVIVVIAISLIGFFWWLGNKASDQKISRQKELELSRTSAAGWDAVGAVIDADTGTVVADARLQAWNRNSIRPRDRSQGMLQARTGKDGSFRFCNVPFPELEIESSDNYYYLDGPPVAAREPEPPPAGTDEAATPETPGDSPAPAAPIALKMKRGGMIAGTVLDGEKRVCPSALVLIEEQAAPTDRTESSPRHHGATRIIRSDKTGAFRFRRLPAGRTQRVTAFHPDWAVSPTVKVNVRAGETAPLSLTLEKGILLSGRVVDAANRPVADAVVFPCGPTPERLKTKKMFPLSPEEGIEAGLAVMTGRDGSFRLTLSPPAAGKEQSPTLFLAARTDGSLTGYSKKIPSAKGDNPHAAMMIALPQSGTIVGLVQKGEADPLAGVIIRAAAVHDGEVFSATARSDAGGAFRLAPLPAEAAATLTFRAAGMPEKVLAGIKPGEKPLTVTLNEGGSLKGTVQSAAGTPVAAFRVFLKQAGSRAGGIRTCQGRQGSFVFGSLTPGAWDLTISAEGFETETLRKVAIEAGKETAAGAVTLNGTRLVSGTVTNAADGKPQAGVRVTPVLEQSDGLLKELNSKTTQTGPQGAFAIHGLEPGLYSLTLFRETPALLWHHDTVRVPPGGTVTGVTVAVAEDAGRLELLVTGRDGKPLPGALVEVLPAARARLLLRSRPYASGGAGGEALPHVFRTGPDGKATIETLTPGQKRVIVATDPTGGDPPLLRIKRIFSVTAGQTASLTVSLAELVLCNLSGTVKRGGKPAAGLLRAVPFDGDMPDPGGARAATIDGTGHYTLPALPAGRYLFSLEDGGTGTIRHQPVDLTGKKGTIPFDCDFPAGRISGVVSARVTGKPLPRASVFAYRIVGSANGIPVGSAVAGGDGTFVFSGLEEGTYLVAAVSGNGTGLVEKIALAAEGSVTGLEVPVSPGGSLEVTVKDEAQKPLEGIMVWAEKSDAAIVTTSRRGLGLSDSLGRVFFRPLEPGTYRVIAGGPGRVSHLEAAVAIEPGKPATVAAVLKKGPQIALAVKSRDGKPVTRCRLAVFGPDNQWIGPPMSGGLITRKGLSNREGNYHIGGYTPGKYSVHVVADGFRPQTTIFTIPAEGGIPPVAVILDPAL
jgi:protocatechuate 3,4-dioxygenase beta subunit